jgi:hypothetical protein
LAANDKRLARNNKSTDGREATNERERFSSRSKAPPDEISQNAKWRTTMSMVETKKDPKLWQVFLIAFAILALSIITLMLPIPWSSAINLAGGITGGIIIAIIYIGAVPFILFMGNAANQKLNLMLFNRELPIGLVTLLAILFVWIPFMLSLLFMR